MWKGNKWDVFTLLITYFVSLLKGMEIGLVVGVLVNIVYLLHLTARPAVEIRRIKVELKVEIISLYTMKTNMKIWIIFRVPLDVNMF